MVARSSSSSTMLTWRRSGCTASASRSWPDRSTTRGYTARSTSSTPTGSSSSSRTRSRASGPAMADGSGDRTAAILDYHQATTHSPESVRRRGHLLDNRTYPAQRDEQEGRGTGSVQDPRRRDGGTQFHLVR